MANNEKASCPGSVLRNSWVDLDRNQSDRRPLTRGDIQGKGNGYRGDPSRAALAALAALDCAIEAAGEAHVVDEVAVDREENEAQVESGVGIRKAEEHHRG